MHNGYYCILNRKYKPCCNQLQSNQIYQNYEDEKIKTAQFRMKILITPTFYLSQKPNVKMN